MSNSKVDGMLDLNGVNDLGKYGPKLWTLMHYVSINVNINDKDWRKHYNIFISCIKELIPCPTCRTHFKQNVLKYRMDQFLVNNESLFIWTYVLHDEVNKFKKVKSPDYEYSRNYYKYLDKSIFSNSLFHCLFTFISSVDSKNTYNIYMLMVSLIYLLPKNISQLLKKCYSNSNPDKKSLFKWIYEDMYLPYYYESKYSIHSDKDIAIFFGLNNK